MEENHFVCSFQGCGKFFKRKDRLEVHFRTHTGERPYICHYDGCGSSYARKQHLTRHIEKSHAVGYEDQSKVRCTHCNKELANKSCLKKHVLNFHAVKTSSSSYKCPEEGCSESFHKKKQLVVHKLQHHSSHLGEARKCYSCTHKGCGRLFTFPNKLKRHLRIHQGYICDVKDCSKVLPNWSSLRKHKAVDHAPTHSCTVCGAIFKQKCNWKQHIKIHTVSQKSYVCPQESCGRLFLYKKNLTQHVRAFHGGEAIWKNRSRKQLVKQKKQRVSRKRSLAARLCGVDDCKDDNQNYQSCTEVSLNMIVSTSGCDATVNCDDQTVHNSFGDKEACLNGASLSVHNSFGDKEACLNDASLSVHNSLGDKEACLNGASSSVHNSLGDKEACLNGARSVHNNFGDIETCINATSPSVQSNLGEKENFLETINSCNKDETDILPCPDVRIFLTCQ